MRMAVFALPARDDSGLQEDLNRFLRPHWVLTMHRESVAQGDNSLWAAGKRVAGRVQPMRRSMASPPEVVTRCCSGSAASACQRDETAWKRSGDPVIEPDSRPQPLRIQTIFMRVSSPATCRARRVPA